MSPSVVADSECLRSGPQQVALSYRIIDRDGSSRWIEDRKISLFAGDGSFLGVEGIVVDAAAAKAREPETRRQRPALPQPDRSRAGRLLADRQTRPLARRQ
jgi:hypothetical protein